MKKAFIIAVLLGAVSPMAFAQDAKKEKPAELSATAQTLAQTQEWNEGLEPLDGVTEPISGNSSKGRTTLVTGVGLGSDGQSVFTGGISHQLSPHLSIFTSTLSSRVGGRVGSGQTTLGLVSTGHQLGGWNLGFSGSFSPGSASLGLQQPEDAATRASEFLPSSDGYSLGASLGRDWGGFSTYLSLQLNHNQAWTSPGLGVARPWQESYWKSSFPGFGPYKSP